ncbi:hypothetical protein [Sagittula sp. S175]|uniref:hypothetical protein n=1 Tax=Sagittula sp. S175 TaxID=3415129 RepID=UPI003C7D766B
MNQRLFLVSSSRVYGELASWEWTGAGLVLRDTKPLSGTSALAAPGGLAVFFAAGLGAFYSFGGAGRGLEGYRVTTTGQIASLGDQGAGAVTLTDISSLEAVVAQDGRDVMLDLGGGLLVFDDTDLGDLSAGMFLLE